MHVLILSMLWLIMKLGKNIITPIQLLPGHMLKNENYYCRIINISG